MERERIKEYSHRYFLAPGECTPEGEMPITLLLTRIIEVATEHADKLGVGYTTLITENQSWVLSRVTIEMKQYPVVNKKYTFTTWIENFNRNFSQRNFEISDDEGNVLGYARTIWVVINGITRESADISKFSHLQEVTSEHPCPIEPQSRLRPVTGGTTSHYAFKYCDLDINQHVNSVRYVELLMNQLPLSDYESNFVKRFEIAYIKECVYAEEMTIAVDHTTDDVKIEITNAEGTSHCRARILLSPRNNK